MTDAKVALVTVDAGLTAAEEKIVENNTAGTYILISWSVYDTAKGQLPTVVSTNEEK